MALTVTETNADILSHDLHPEVHAENLPVRGVHATAGGTLDPVPVTATDTVVTEDAIDLQVATGAGDVSTPEANLHAHLEVLQTDLASDPQLFGKETDDADPTGPTPSVTRL